MSGRPIASQVSAASDSVAQDALPVGVVVEPVPQPWPGPGERLVGQLDDTVVAGDEAGPDEQLDDLLVVVDPWRPLAVASACAPAPRPGSG